MDSTLIFERIDSGALSFEEELGTVKYRVELEAADKLGLLVKRLDVTLGAMPGHVPSILRNQAAAVVERLEYIDRLRVIEVDGIVNAVQIRSEKPSEEGFVEIVLRGGNSISFEKRGTPLHLSRKDFNRLVSDLASL
jgi:hypothetical protein